MGGKSDGLARLVAAGERVPLYVVVAGADQVASALARLGTGPYAVRSDAADEDGTGSAQAGRYDSYLGVSAAELVGRVAAVREGYGGTVIVQRMVAADASGVAFSAHPAGILDQVVVTAGPGPGAVVSGDGPTRTWVTSTADRRRYTYGSDPDVGDLLTPAQVDEVTSAALRVAETQGRPVDVEWAYERDRLWLLQARPVTTLDSVRTTLDNSNLVESYPGLVSPLTASFVPRAYEGVFRSLALRVTRDPTLVERYADVLRRMVAGSSGRLYYRMESWYAVLGLMPLSRRYIDVWQASLGITERAYARPPVRIGRRSRLRAAAGLMRELLRTPAQLSALAVRVEQVRGWLPESLAAASSLSDLRALYERVQADLLDHWDVTLLNDVRAFVLPALLRGLVRDGAAVNDLVSGIASIESLKPVRELAALAADAPADLARVVGADEAARYLARDSPYAARLRAYVETYGDRYLEELKLESPTFRTDPLLLVEAVRAYGDGSPPLWREGAAPGSLESDQLVTSETPHTTSPGVSPTKATTWSLPSSATPPSQPPTSHAAAGTSRSPALRTRNPLTRALAPAATRAIAGREASRLDRARVYGMVRSIALTAGRMLAADGRLDDPGDVFWLTVDELFDPPTDTARRVTERKHDHDSFSRLPAFRRLTFAGEPFDTHVPGAFASAGSVPNAPTLTGLGVSGGTATGEVLVVTDPRAVGDPTGRVLVTTMTDPGWVFLLSRAAAIVAERGSLLSHTAIVARELGIPAVVAIPDATRAFADGERVTVDGTRGEVRR